MPWSDRGLAVAYRDYSLKYVPNEERAKAARRGPWAGTFETPTYRTRSPATVAFPAEGTMARDVRTANMRAPDVRAVSALFSCSLSLYCGGYKLKLGLFLV
jgi:hypothetical protein